MAENILNWLKGHLSPHKIDYMSLNRLRQNQSVTSSIPTRLSLAEKTRRADNLIRLHSQDTSVSFEEMTLTRNPYGVTPLTALAIFHTETPCRLSYTIHCEKGSEDFHFDYDEMNTSHIAPVFGLYADAVNEITITLFREDGSELASRTFEWKTDAIPTDYHYPVLRDSMGEVRYILTIPTQDGKLYPVSECHYLLVNDKMRTRTGKEPLPTHIHEVDLLGRTYQTIYVGNGILSIYDTKDMQNGLSITISGLDGKDSFLVFIDRTTGSIVRTSKDFDRDKACRGILLERRHLQEISLDSHSWFSTCGKNLQKVEYPETGWLRPPVLYRAASVENSSAVSLEDIKKDYHLSFAIIGNNLTINTENDDIQEIVFSRADHLYEWDLTEPPLADTEYETYHYTLVVPFTEMHSGTYSVVIRFRDGGQAVLQDTITLSRERGQ